MITRQILAIVAPTLARSVRRWIFHLGGLGFIPLGLLDSSVIPLPGSMDILAIVLSARKKELWLYYALMATIGSVIGGTPPTGWLAKAGRKRSNASSPGVPGSPLWPADTHYGHVATWTASPHRH
jgi:membrane protein YqaA with SNARE-associated domain